MPCCVFPRLMQWRRVAEWPESERPSFESLTAALPLENARAVRSYEDFCAYFAGFGLLLGFHRFLTNAAAESFAGWPCVTGGCVRA